MGQKINPFSLRLGIIKDWASRWYPSKKGYRDQLEEDMIIRRVVHEMISLAGIVHVVIERSANSGYRLLIKAARPGLIIGRGGKGIEDLTAAIEKALKKLYRERGQEATKKIALSVNVEELKRTEVSAQYVAQGLAWDIEKRLPFRRLLKKTLENLKQNREVQGAKIRFSGRLDGAEISRSEWLSYGKLPLQTLRGNVDYGQATAFTTYGTVGIKVWVYKGEVFKKKVKN